MVALGLCQRMLQIFDLASASHQGRCRKKALTRGGVQAMQLDTRGLAHGVDCGLGRCEALRWIAVQQATDDVAQRNRQTIERQDTSRPARHHLGIALQYRGRPAGALQQRQKTSGKARAVFWPHDVPQEGGGRIANKWIVAGQRFPQQDSDGIQVGCHRRCCTDQKLWRHVFQRAGHVVYTRSVRRDAKVEDLHAPLRQEHVRGFQIAMHNSVPVQVRKRGQKLYRKRADVMGAQPMGAEGKRLRIGQQLHGEKGRAFLVESIVENTDDVRMPQRRKRAEFVRDRKPLMLQHGDLSGAQGRALAQPRWGLRVQRIVDGQVAGWRQDQGLRDLGQRGLWTGVLAGPSNVL